MISLPLPWPALSPVRQLAALALLTQPLFAGASPEVSSIEALPGGAVSECREVREHTSQLAVTFSEAMANPLGNSASEDVTNPSNYRLVAAGGDRDFDTFTCGAAQGDDTLISIPSVAYDAGSRTATLELGDVPTGPVRLLVCDTLENATGTAMVATHSTTFRSQPESHVGNGNFDCNLGNWGYSGGPDLFEQFQLSDEDIDTSSVSGSLRVMQTNDTTQFLLNNACFDAGPGEEYVSRAGILVKTAAPDLDFFGYCFVSTAPDCDAIDQELTLLYTLDLVPTGGQWQSVHRKLDVTPAGTESMICGFGLTTYSGGNFELHLDALELLGTALLADGFESGDTSAWSTTVF